MKYITKLIIGLILIALVSCSKSPSKTDIDTPILPSEISQQTQIFTPRTPGIPLNPIALNRLAELITVEIVIPNSTTAGGRFSSAGSGVIIGKKDSTYYVLTANHVFPYNNEYLVSIRSQKPGEAAETQKLKFIRRYPEQDLAVIAFASVSNYQIAEVGEASLLNNDSQIYVAGWPSNEERQGFQFTPVKVTNPRVGDNFNYQPTVIGESVYKGMSGGAVLNETGQLVGIHRGLTSDWVDGEGVLISTFLRMAPPEVSEALVKPVLFASPAPTPVVVIESSPSPVSSPSPTPVHVVPGGFCGWLGGFLVWELLEGWPGWFVVLCGGFFILVVWDIRDGSTHWLFFGFFEAVCILSFLVVVAAMGLFSDNCNI